jgi:hypothetical protein
LPIEKIPNLVDSNGFWNSIASEVDKVDNFFLDVVYSMASSKPPEQSPCIKRGEPRVRVSPFKPPPPLPPDCPGLCVLGVEDYELVEVQIMEDRGRGRGRGNSGRGDRQQHQIQQYQNIPEFPQM